MTPEWYGYEGGITVGKRGPEGGVVVSDEELGDPEDPEDADARLTLERSATGFTVVANLYGGWMYVVAQCSDSDEAATQTRETLRAELERLSGMIPMDDERDIDGKVRNLMENVAVVEARYA